MIRPGRGSAARTGSAARAAWAALLSLAVPGLGQLYAGAWRLGLMLVALNEALSLAARAVTSAAAPMLPALAAVAALIVASVGLMLATAIDAARRVRREPPAPRPAWFSSTWFRSTWFVALVLLAFGFAIDAALPFGWRAFNIPSASMVPTLLVGDYVLADGRPGFTPARGDVVIFTQPKDPETYFVKRIIGLPGDHVAMHDGVLTLNGAAVPQQDAGETLIEEDMHFSTKARRYTETIPGARPYPVVKLTGTGPANNTPDTLVEPGTAFVMGDNRDDSLDSRFASFGPVPLDRIVGQARTIYWSRDRARILTAIP